MALSKLTDIRKSLSVEVEDLQVNGIGTFSGNVSIGGTLTYQDVTNIDSVGLITAKSGINVTGGILNITNSENTLGILSSTDSGANIDLFDDDTQTRIRTVDGKLNLYADMGNSVSDSAIRFFVDGANPANEKLRIDSNGDMALGGSPITSGYTSFTIHESGTGNSDHVRFNMTNGNTGNTASDGFSITVNASTKNTHLIQRETADMVFQTAGSERLRILSSGEIGIGITNPTKTGIQNLVKVLQIDGGDGAELILGNSQSSNVAANHIGAIAFKNIDNSVSAAPNYAGIRCNATDTVGNMNLKFYAGSTAFESDTPHMTIISNGNVGIGTLNPLTSLHVADTNTTVWPFTSAVSTNYSYNPYPHELVIDNDVKGTEGSFAGIFFNAGSDTDGSKVSTARIAAVDTGSYKADLVFSNRGSGGSSHKENLRITSNGRVGIGITNPTLDLQISGNLGIGKTASNGSYGYFVPYNDGTGDMEFHLNWPGGSTESMRFYLTGNERMRIRPEGYVTIPQLPYFYCTATPTAGNPNIHSFGNVHGNNGNHYNNSNGRFTAPVDGFYWFSCGIWCNSSSTNTSYLIQLQRYNAALGASTAFAGANHRTQYNSLNCSGGTYMAKNDYVWIEQTGISIQASTPRNYFSGYLVG